MEEPTIPDGDTKAASIENLPTLSDESMESTLPVGEPDHCRICRGERTIEEPLFYPCKCNGSIRYVHQACLMQWLSHSQKKHCELCKTPFRFTKLYDPHMPSTVPWPVFIRQASVHVVRFVLKCARWILVLFVWLGWVPWCMRAVWRGLFWVGDGSWITQQQLERQSKALSNATTTLSSQTIFSTQLPPMPEPSSTNWGPIFQTLNFGASEPLILWAGRRFLNTIIFPYSALANSSVEIRWVETPPRNPSLLSDVKVLKAPTRWRFVNDTIIDVLEGQLITIGILITFILMFLIREWVVQQQPMINLGQALDGEAANPQPQPRAAPAIAQPDDIAEVDDQEAAQIASQPATPTEDRSFNQDTLPGDVRRTDSIDALPPTPRSNFDDLPELSEVSVEDPTLLSGNAEDGHQEHLYITPPQSDIGDPYHESSDAGDMPNDTARSSSRLSPTRPPMPSKEAFSKASDIARTLEEQSRAIEGDDPSASPHSSASGDDNLILTPDRTSSEAVETENDASPNVEAESSSQQANPTPSLRNANQMDQRPAMAGIVDWMWGDIPNDENIAGDSSSDWQTEAASSDGESDDSDQEDEDEEVENNVEAAPAQLGAALVPVGPMQNMQQDPEVLRAAAEAGIDPNEVQQIEEGEDMDGVMELIGMQGPLAGLLQNGMFSTVIISMTVLFGIWLPYLIGKVVLIILANPISLLVKMPLRWTSTIADLIVDSFIFVAGCAYYWVDKFFRLTATPLAWALPFVRNAQIDERISKTAHRLTWSAADRLAKNLAITGGHFSDSDIPVFSILAHESLKKIQGNLYGVSAWFFFGIKNIVDSSSPIAFVGSQMALGLRNLYGIVFNLPFRTVTSFPQALKALKPSIDMLKINLDIPTRSAPLQVSSWSTGDRVIAVILGYTFFAGMGILYLKIRKIVRELNDMERPVDGFVVDLMNQSGGIFKVILIITIEMLVFPLYCGFLLDTALLPLFGNATLSSRIAFLSASPWTSVFIHWFAGTCYMFHFALFVAMCRKILRTGVLYFIRDPDDPSFHPVRDVLERNVTTQLRKILFSALVYGALVIVCLGAVVWGISTIVKDVFPIHWSSNEPVLEFPADLLVYNFLMPLAVKVIKPSAGLQDMYNWWFRKCARLLRLSHFLFNERNEDEEGYIVWKKVAPDEEIEESKARKDFKWPIIRDGRLSWQTRATKSSDIAERHSTERRRSIEPDPPAGYKKVFVHDGRLVRAPASDQVRIPKGNKTFVDLDPETENRKDGLPENPQGLHGKDNKMFANIYVPPYFRVRIASFIVLIWAFAAFTGVSLTIVPLLFGRFVFARLIQSHPRMNDVYAFAIGFYLLAGPSWLAMKYRTEIMATVQRLRSSNTLSMNTIRNHIPKAIRLLLQSLRVIYFYTAFMVLLPSLLGLTWEAYILIPLHTYFQRTEHLIPPHTVHFVSDWTLGVLFTRVAVHLMLKYPQSRPTKALLALVSPQNRGSSWLDPDIRLATRAFIIPLTIVSVLVLVLPLGLVRLLLTTVFEGLGGVSQTLIYRYSYPIFMAFNLAFALLRALRRGINRWRSRVRDEVYLIGERLHNFDERRNKIAKQET